MNRDREQQTARVNVDDNTWRRFRIRALRQDRSIADYLGELVRRELDGNRGRHQRPGATENDSESAQADEPAGHSEADPEQPQPATKPPIRLGDADLLTELSRPRPKPPPWEP